MGIFPRLDNTKFAQRLAVSRNKKPGDESGLVLLRLSSLTGFPSRFQFGDAFDGHFPVHRIPVIHVIRGNFIGFASGIF